MEINVHVKTEKLVVGKMPHWLKVHTGLGEDPN